MKKLLFIHHLTSLEDETLAKEVLTVQDHHDLPGLVSECKGYFEKYKLPNILKQKMKKSKWKGLVKKAIQTANAEELRSDMDSYRKLENSELLLEDFRRQPYLTELNLADCRTKFKYRTKMTQYIKMNYSSEIRYSEDLWRCDSCRTKIDSQSHVLWCSSYASLREGKDLSSDADLCSYLQKVMEIRHERNISK